MKHAKEINMVIEAVNTFNINKLLYYNRQHKHDIKL